MKKSTLLESTIARRNFYQERKVENLVNEIFFNEKAIEIKKLRDSADVDSEERAQLNKELLSAESGVRNAEANREPDNLLMKSFDVLIERIEKGEVV